MTLNQIVQLAVNSVNILFLGYLIVYASACPSAPLISAVIFELVVYAAVLGFRVWKSRQPKTEDQVEVEALHEKWTALRRFRKAYQLSVIVVACTAALYLSIDLSALVTARLGHLNRACEIYRRICLIATPAVHPGLSMEFLAGAYIESKQLDKAEPIMITVMRLRESLVGTRHELVADIFSNLADLYAKEKQFDKAEDYYKRAIALTKDLRLPQGYGSPMTKLASLYASQSRAADSDRAFDEAVAIRSQIFGINSVKVSETLIAQIDALKLQGRNSDAEVVQQRLSRICLSKPKSEISETVVPLSISAASLLFLWKRDRIFLITANLLKKHR